VKFFGHGADVDILHAAAKAYVNGINRMLCAREDAAEGPWPVRRPLMWRKSHSFIL